MSRPRDDAPIDPRIRQRRERSSAAGPRRRLRWVAVAGRRVVVLVAGWP